MMPSSSEMVDEQQSSSRQSLSTASHRASRRLTSQNAPLGHNAHSFQENPNPSSESNDIDMSDPVGLPPPPTASSATSGANKQTIRQRNFFGFHPSQLVDDLLIATGQLCSRALDALEYQLCDLFDVHATQPGTHSHEKSTTGKRSNYQKKKQLRAPLTQQQIREQDFKSARIRNLIKKVVEQYEERLFNATNGFPSLFDRFEVYCLNNIFHIPDDLYIPEKVFFALPPSAPEIQPHQNDDSSALVHVQVPENQQTFEEKDAKLDRDLLELQKEITAMENKIATLKIICLSFPFFIVLHCSSFFLSPDAKNCSFSSSNLPSLFKDPAFDPRLKHKVSQINEEASCLLRETTLFVETNTVKQVQLRRQKQGDHNKNSLSQLQPPSSSFSSSHPFSETSFTFSISSSSNSIS